MDALYIFGIALEDIQRDVNHLTEPLERKYLRFTSPSIQEKFTIYNRFKDA
jgi:hypothetical protein